MFKTYAHTVVKALQWCRNVMTVHLSILKPSWSWKTVFRCAKSLVYSVHLLAEAHVFSDIEMTTCIWRGGGEKRWAGGQCFIRRMNFLSKARFPKRMRGERTLLDLWKAEPKQWMGSFCLWVDVKTEEAWQSFREHKTRH